MRRFAMCAALALVPWLSGMLSAEGAAAPKRPLRPDPEVEIISPADNTATNAASIPVKVHFRGQIQILGKKTIPIGLIQEVILKADGVVVGRYDPRRPVHEGNYTFTLKLSTYPDKVVALQAFASQGKGRREETAESDIVNLLVDRTKPVLTASLSPVPTASGWNNSPVTVTFIATDNLSGIATVTAPVTISGEGAGQLVTGTATDKAGNSVTLTATVNIDKTAPVLSAALSPLPNGASWNKSDVTVTFTATDALSGVLNITPPATISLDGAGRLVLGTVTDKAGNTATLSATVNLDKTPPSLSAALSPAPNSAGWNNSDVTVTFTATDNLSGVAGVSAPQTISTEGANQIISGSASDKAGNPADVTATVSLDKTAPVISSLLPASGSTPDSARPAFSASFADTLSGVDPAGVHITLDGTDITSQCAVTASGFTFTPAQDLVDGLRTLAVTIADIAGNSASASTSFTILTQDTDGDGIPDNLDNNPLVPFVKITSPASNALTNRALMEISGTVDPLAVRVEVKNTTRPDIAPSAIFPSGAATFLAAGIPLVEGANIIEATATDATGRLNAISRITLNADQTSPTLAVAPASGARVLDQTGLVTPLHVAFTETGLSGGVAPATFKAFFVKKAFDSVYGFPVWNGVKWVYDVFFQHTIQDITGRFTVSSTEATLSGGTEIGFGKTDASAYINNLIIYVVADKAGNYVFGTATYKIDEVAPVVTIDSPANGSTVSVPSGGMLSISATLSDDFSGLRGELYDWANRPGIILNGGDIRNQVLNLTLTPALGNSANPVSNATMTVDIPETLLSAGPNALSIHVNDHESNSGSAAITFDVPKPESGVPFDVDVADVDIPITATSCLGNITITKKLSEWPKASNMMLYVTATSQDGQMGSGQATVLEFGLNTVSVKFPDVANPPQGPFHVDAALLIESAGAYCDGLYVSLQGGDICSISADNLPAGGFVGSLPTALSAQAGFMNSQFAPSALVIAPGDTANFRATNFHLPGEGVFAWSDIFEMESTGEYDGCADTFRVHALKPGLTGLNGGSSCAYIWGEIGQSTNLSICVKGVRIPDASLVKVVPGVELSLKAGEILGVAGFSADNDPQVSIRGVVDDGIAKAFNAYGPENIRASGEETPLVEIRYPESAGTLAGKLTGRFSFNGPVTLRRGRNSVAFSVANALGNAGKAVAVIDVQDQDGNPLTNDFLITVVSVENSKSSGDVGVLNGFYAGPPPAMITVENPRGDIRQVNLELPAGGSYESGRGIQHTGRFILAPEGSFIPENVTATLAVLPARIGDKIEAKDGSPYEDAVTVPGTDYQFAPEGASAITVESGTDLQLVVALTESDLASLEEARVMRNISGPFTAIPANLASFDAKGVRLVNQSGEPPVDQNMMLIRVGTTPVFRSAAIRFSAGSAEDAGLTHRIIPEGRVTFVATLEIPAYEDYPSYTRTWTASRQINGYRLTPQESSRSNTPTGGSGIYLHNGEFVHTATDLVLPTAKGPGFAFTRAYRSQITHEGPLGYGWDHVYFQRLVEKDDDGDGVMDAVSYNGLGRRDVYRGNGGLGMGNGDFISPPGFYDLLERDAAGFSRTDGSGTVLRYQTLTARPTEYVLVSITDRLGNRMAFFYNAQGQLERINDSQDRNIAYRYFTAADFSGALTGKLKEIEDFAGRKVAFEYNTTTKDLVKVTLPTVPVDGGGTTAPTTRYAYPGGSVSYLAHNLVKITDAKSQEYLENTYAADDRVQSQCLGTGSVGIQYIGGSSGSAGSTLFTDANTHVWIYLWDENHPELAAAVTDPAPSGQTTHYTFTADNEIEEITYPLLNKIHYVYAGGDDPITRGNLLSTLQIPDGARGGDYAVIQTETTYTTKTDFDPEAPAEASRWNFVKKATDADGNVTEYAYNDKGNLVKTIRKNIQKTETAAEDLVTEYRYNASGQVDAVLAPDKSITWYEYYESNGRPGDASDLEGYQKRAIQSTDRGHVLSLIETPPTNPRANPELYLVTESVPDMRGNVVTMVDAKGSAWVRTFDALDRLTEEISPPVFGTARNHTLYAYDANGNLAKTTRQTPSPDDPYGTSVSMKSQVVTRTFDTLDRPLSATEGDRLSQTRYDANGNPIASIDPVGRIRTQGYDARNLLAREVIGDTDLNAWTVPPGATLVEYTPDANGNVEKTFLNGIQTATNTYDGFDRLTQSKDPRTLALTETQYDQRGNVVVEKTSVATGNPVRYIVSEYNGMGDLLRRTDLARITENGAPAAEYKTDILYTTGETREYDPETGLPTITRTDGASRDVECETPGGAKIVWVRNPDDTIQTETQQGNGWSATTRYAYNALGHLVEITHPDTTLTKITPDGEGNAVFVTDAERRVIHREINPHGELVAETSGWGTPGVVTTGHEYWPDGRIKTLTRGNLRMTWNYDSRGNVQEIQHDRGGVLTSEVFNVDESGRLKYQKRRDGTYLNYTYYGESPLVKEVTDGTRTLRTYGAHDALGRPKEILESNDPATSLDDVETQLAYGSDGQVTLDRQGVKGVWVNVQTQNSAYDQSGNCREVIYPGEGLEAWTAHRNHLATGELEKIGEAEDRDDVIRYHRAGLGRITGYDVARGAAHPIVASIGHDPNGRVAGMTWAGLGDLRYERDGNGRKTAVVKNGSARQYGYDGHGRFISGDYHNTAGLGDDRFHLDDLDNRTTGNLVNGVPTDYAITEGVKVATVATPGNADSYAYDNRGNVTGDGRYQYAWDAFSRLVRVTNPNPTSQETPIPGATVSIEDLPSGFRRTTFRFPDPQTANCFHLEGADDTSHANVEAETTPGSWCEVPDQTTTATATGRRLEFQNVTVRGLRVNEDLTGKLSNVIEPRQIAWHPWKEVKYLYDGLGRRVAASVDKERYRHVYHEKQLIEVRRERDGLLIHRFVYGENLNEPVAMWDILLNRTILFVRDELNNVVAITDTNGYVLERYEYNAFGETRIIDPGTGLVKMWDHDGNPATSDVPKITSDFGNPFGYAGMWRDPATGLYMTHFRVYKPETGRWLSEDPVGFPDGMNPYCYYAGPNGVDPEGRIVFLPYLVWAGSGALLGGGVELARELIAGESISWGSIGTQAGIGAVAGPIFGRLWTAGRIGQVVVTGAAAGFTTAGGYQTYITAQDYGWASRQTMGSAFVTGVGLVGTTLSAYAMEGMMSRVAMRQRVMANITGNRMALNTSRFGFSKQVFAAKGTRGLDIGGGKFPGDPRAIRTPKGYVSVNVDPGAVPSVVGEAKALPFRSGAFPEVRFTRFPYTEMTPNVFAEAKRVLRLGGYLRITTGPGAPIEALTADLRAAGFTNITVGTEGGIPLIQAVR